MIGQSFCSRLKTFLPIALLSQRGTSQSSLDKRARPFSSPGSSVPEEADVSLRRHPARRLGAPLALARLPALLHRRTFPLLTDALRNRQEPPELKQAIPADLWKFAENLAIENASNLGPAGT